LASEDFRFNAHFEDLLLAVHFDGDHAAAGRGFDSDRIHLPLQVFLHLPQPRKHLLKRVDFHQVSSCCRRTSEILPPKRCSIDFTIGSLSNCARSSCVLGSVRDTDAAAAATCSILAHTRTGRPSTLLETPRIFSSESRPSIMSANARLSCAKNMRSSVPSSSQR